MKLNPLSLTVRGLLLSFLVVSELAALQPGVTVGFWWENQAKKSGDNLGVRWGFASQALDANFTLNNVELGSTRPIDLANVHFEVRSPVLELGTMAPPEYWSCLAGSLSGLEALIPTNPAFGRNADWFRYALPLRFSSLARSESSRMVGAGFGLPRYFSTMFFRNMSGDYACWDNLGLMGVIPISGGGETDPWMAKLSGAWYHSWFQPVGQAGAWIPSEDGSGLLVHCSDDWWLEEEQLRPAELDHGQVSLLVATDYLRLILLGQQSMARSMESGTFLGGWAELLLHDAEGGLVCQIDLGGSSASAGYRDPRGQKATIQDSVKGKVLFWPWRELVVKLAAGWALSAFPSPANYGARYRAIDGTWQVGLDYIGKICQAGISLDESQSRAESGIISQKQQLGGQISLIFGQQTNLKLGIGADLALSSWQIDTFCIKPAVALNLESGSFTGHVTVQVGWDLPVADSQDDVRVSGVISASTAWTLGDSTCLELRGSLGLPDNSTRSKLGAIGAGNWWSSLERRIEFSYHP